MWWTMTPHSARSFLSSQLSTGVPKVIIQVCIIYLYFYGNVRNCVIVILEHQSNVAFIGIQSLAKQLMWGGNESPRSVFINYSLFNHSLVLVVIKIMPPQKKYIC